jgi:outer membrane protein TolC
MSQNARLNRSQGMRLQFVAFALMVLIPLTAATDEKLTYKAFLKAAIAQNLSLKIEAAKSEAARENSKRLSVPPPMISYMKMTETNGSSAHGIEVNQTIPFPTKITNGRSARKLEAEAQDAKLKGVEAETIASARLVYFNLWAIQERRTALEEKKQVVESHLKLARAGVRSDSFLRIHLLKAETDLDLLENEILASDQAVREKEVVMAEFLNLDPTNFHKSLAEPPLQTIPNLYMAPPAHQLEFARLQFESFKAKESEAKSSWFPDLNLQYKEIGKTQMNTGYSQVTVGLSLPFLFPWEPSAISGNASAMRFQSELEYEKEKRKIESERSLFLAKATSLKKQLDNITQKLLPRAEKRMRLVHNLAPRDMDTLQDQRETMEAFPELKLKALDLKMEYEAAVAELNKFEVANE